MKNDNVDTLLKKALSSTETPEVELIQKVKYKLIKEEPILRKSTIRRSFSAAAVAVMAFVLISTTAFAAWYFLSPSEIADKLEYPILAEAFRSDDALLINETQSQNGYDVSFLGIVSGKELTELDETVNTAKSYAVVAIAKQESSMPDTSNDNYDSVPFFVSPLITGQEPWLYNIASMNGGYAACVVDGVMYRLIECDSLEMFADRGLALIVSSTTFYDVNAYTYDEATGLVTPNPDFDGVNMIFDLPLDSSKADYEKAQTYLDTLWNDKDTSNIDPGETIGENGADITINQTETGFVSKQVMTYDTLKEWTENQLKEIQKMVDSGEYSGASMELDRQDFEEKLNSIENGATVTLYLNEDGSYILSTTYSNSGYDVDVNASGEISITN